MLVHRIAIGLALAMGLLSLACLGSLRAADKEGEKNAEKAKAEQNDDAEDPYKLPAGGVKELLAFIKEMQARRLSVKTREAFVEFQTKGRPAMKAAAEKIQQTATDEDKQLEGYDNAMALLLLGRAEEVRSTSLKEIKQLVADIKAALSTSENPNPQAVMAAMQVGAGLEYNQRPELKELAPDVYRDLGGVLSRSKDPQAARTGVKMAGAARRLSLLGKPLELSGTDMDGGKFDWAKYRGKVVLVDFWATWCGPCIAELPNVKKNYELYHDRGFEVVGISVDQDRDKLEAFLEKEQNPWITLHDGNPDENAMATYYGIMGIPTVILVDKAGKVVSTNARGPELVKQLAALLGPPNPDETEKPDGDAAK